MASYKTARMGEDVKRELTDIFRSLKDPRVDPMLTVVHVDLPSDMATCKVYVSSLSGIERAKESVKGLQSGAGYIRRELCHRLDMRRSPELTFIADNSIEHGVEIAKKLGELL